MSARLMICFEKGDEVRFLSHLDLMRTLQRAFRRADVPLFFSQGFNPHPVMAFASALGVGIASVREYMEVTLRHECPVELFLQRMQPALPTGLRMHTAVFLPENAPSLMAALSDSDYQIQVTDTMEKGTQIGNAVPLLLAQQDAVVERTSKHGTRNMDIRPGIHSLVWDDGLHARLASGSQLSIRPKEVLQALCGIAKIDELPSFTVTRLECYVGERTMAEWARNGAVS